MREDHHPEDELDRIMTEGLRDFGEGLESSHGLSERDETLLALTGARVRARGHRRRLVLVAAVLVSFALGFWGGAWRGGGGEAIEPADAPTQEDHESPRDRVLDPRDLETRAANLAAAERAAALKEAGDRYLAEWGDVSAALRCYRQVCNLLPTEDAGRIEPGDSWLLVALKSDRSD